MSGSNQNQLITQLFPREHWIKLLDNNFQLDLKLFKCQDPVIPAIIKGHYICIAFHKATSIPEIYLQEFRDNMYTSSKKDRTKIFTKLNNMRVVLTPSTLREALKLPLLNNYAPLPTNETLITGMLDLGYDAPLTLISNFCITNLPHPWKSLFGLVNKCLSSKHVGHDKCNKQILQIFHGIAFNIQYDMAQLFWTELTDQVKAKEKNKRGTIPYARWLALIINDIMTSNPAIPRRSEEHHFVAPKLKYFKKDNHNAAGMAIPESLLTLANQKDPAVVQYREALQRTVPMVQQTPARPFQRAKLSASKGPKRAKPPQKPVARQPNGDQSDHSSERTQTAEGHTHDAEEPVDEPSSPATNKADGVASDSMAERRSADDDEDEDDDINDDEATESLTQKSKRAGKQIIKVNTADYEEADHLRKPQKGIIISETRSKQQNDIISSPKPKKRLVKKSIIEEEMDLYADCEPFLQISRTSPLGAGADLVSSRVEVAASGSTAHSQPSPTHFSASQQAGVSITQGELIPTSLVLFGSVERISGQQPQTTTPPSNTSSLGVTFPTFSAFSRAPILLTAHTGTHTLNATTRVQTMTVGSPATHTMTQSLNAGHTSAIFTDDVTTVTTPVTGTLIPEDLAVLLNRFLESTIMPWVHQTITARAQEFRNTQMVQSEHTQPQPQPTPAHSQPQNIPTLSPHESDTSTNKPTRPTNSRRTHDTELVSSPPSTTPHPNPYTMSLTHLSDIMFLRLLETEERHLTPLQRALLQVFLKHDSPCRDSPRGHKRSHEDPDDSAPHEGENKRPRTLEHGALTSQTLQPNQPSSSTNQQPPSSTQNQTASLQISSPIKLDKTFQGLSPR
ncbi:unnamed protein product [Cuscuta europaea]|nr:unnamed protein product [Cuscuta europaea]